MNQVHKETLTHVENTLEGRDGLEVEIFGMEGIPEDAAVAHNSKIIEDFHKNRAERQAVTGNPPPGLPGSNQPPHKKLKIETAAELKARLAAFRASGGVAAAPPPNAPTGPAAAAGAALAPTAGLPSRPPAGPFASNQFPGHPGQIPGQFTGQFPGQFPGPFSSQMPGPFPAGAPGDLPQRPAALGGASTLDDLVSGAAAGVAPPSGDDIDRMIRAAEAGVRPGGDGKDKPEKTEKTEKSEKKKEKASMRMVYADGDFSLEEKMAQMPRYAVAV